MDTKKTPAPKPAKAAAPKAAKAPAAKVAAPKSGAAKPAPRKSGTKAAAPKKAAPTAARAKPAPATATARATRSGPSRALGAFSIGAALVAIGAAVVETLRRLRGADNAGHSAPDLAPDQDRPGPGDRAPDAFRPDGTAPVPASEREALRPATLPLGSGRELDSVH